MKRIVHIFTVGMIYTLSVMISFSLVTNLFSLSKGKLPKYVSHCVLFRRPVAVFLLLVYWFLTL